MNQKSPLADWTVDDSASDLEATDEARLTEKRKFISPLNLFARRQMAVPTPAVAPQMDENDIDEDILRDISIGAAATMPETDAEPPAHQEFTDDADTDEMAGYELVELQPEQSEEPQTSLGTGTVAQDAEATESVATEELPLARPEAPAAASHPAAAPVERFEAVSQPQTSPVTGASATPVPDRRNSRVKTTFLGFERSDGRIEDVFEKARDVASAERSLFPVGWIVIVDGPGRGNSITLQAGVSQIGRGDDQAVQLNFGDTGISRSNHAAIAYDDEDRNFYLGHGGKSNIVRLNGKPVLSTEPLENGDTIRMGETTMTFVAFCGSDFHWSDIG